MEETRNTSKVAEATSSGIGPEIGREEAPSEGGGTGPAVSKDSGGPEPATAESEDSPPEAGPSDEQADEGCGGSQPASARRHQTGGVQVRVTPVEKMLILSAWKKSGLSAAVFAPLVHLSTAALQKWQHAFELHGPAGLEGKPPGAPTGSRLPDSTKQAILLLKQNNPDWGLERIHDVLLRSDGFSASPGAIRRVLLENGYEVVVEETSRHPDKPRSFERARPGQLWQSDIFTFTLPRANARVHLVIFMDDHSRFVTAHRLMSTATGRQVQEALSEGIANFGAPEELLTDQGPQYYAWRGTSALTKYLRSRGIRHLVARAHHPQTLGKAERFWKTLWAELLEEAIFTDLGEARERITLYIDWYNFRRPHQGIEGLVPADRMFSATDAVRKTLEARVAANALELARHGQPRKPFYLTGRVGNESISLHAEGAKVVLTTEAGVREEVELKPGGLGTLLEDATEKPSDDDEGKE